MTLVCTNSVDGEPRATVQTSHRVCREQVTAAILKRAQKIEVRPSEIVANKRRFSKKIVECEVRHWIEKCGSDFAMFARSEWGFSESDWEYAEAYCGSLFPVLT